MLEPIMLSELATTSAMRSRSSKEFLDSVGENGVLVPITVPDTPQPQTAT